MKVAIVGAGFSGLATGWFLLSHPSLIHRVSITFFDPLGVGEGASGIAAGLMHPFSGAAAKLNTNGLEGYSATCKLLNLISEKIGKSVIKSHGLLRLAITERQKYEYRITADKYEDVSWYEPEEIMQKISGLSFHPGIFIKKSVTVNCKLYLEGLRKACEEQGARFEKSLVKSIEELSHFDQIILATGNAVNKLIPSLQLPVTEVKGQVIEVAWPKNLDPLPYAINSHAYLLMDENTSTCTIGATYERNFETDAVEVNYAVQEILPKAEAILPALKGVSVLNCRVGIRASTPDHMPIIKKLGNKCWVITGMGSKGLLYHALYAERLVSMMLN